MKSDFVLLLSLLLVLISWLEHPQAVAALPTICSLPPMKGSCENRLTRFYYNHQHKRCEKFVYGGCLGNGNKFQTLESCEKMCKVSKGPPTRPMPSPSTRPMPSPSTRPMPSPSTGPSQDQSVALPTVCSLPPSQGPCENRLTRYYYNHNHKQCETFIYGGCLGNGNKFQTPESCEKWCKVSKVLPMPSPSTKSVPSPPTRPTPSPSTRPTPSPSTGPSLDVSVALPTVCSLPPSKGPCTNRLTRYYYNHNHKQCETFIYGGCLGNGNKFQTLESCENWCKVSKAVPPVCRLPPSKGPCNNRLTRYYYNHHHKKCETFVYGGCMGNGNLFQTSDSCKKWCKVSKEVLPTPSTRPEEETTTAPSVKEVPVSGRENLPSICKLPPEQGKCQARHTRYYYNMEKHACEKFIYTGCLGNANRFLTATKCNQKCETITGIPTICTVPKNTGSCSEKISRYYYNQKSKHCEQFIYSGCGGNANNFSSSQECKRLCLA
ncbi:actinia tenebrosa protease inhibitors isoform X1 [Anolis carolinensis]|uniref:actinia tenebrosa protease inhibitors isoform X1 n=1 Tax=Anolis carolinensis TaxID=28377 RepID=UPI002F2B529E